MRRSVLAGLFALTLVAWPAPDAAGQSVPGERVVLDSTIRVMPIQNTGLCMEIEPGTLTTTVQSVGDPKAQVSFIVGPDGSGTFSGEYVNTMVPTAPVTYQTAVRQPFTCMSLLDQSDPRMVGSTHKVAVRIVWTPQ